MKYLVDTRLRYFVCRDPVLSIDFQLSGTDGITRLATAGSDNHVVVKQFSLSVNLVTIL